MPIRAYLLASTQEAETDTVEAWAEALGDVPLALAQAVASIEATGMTLAVYLRMSGEK